MISNIAMIVSVLFGAGGFAAGLVAVLKVNPERRKIFAEAWRAGAETEQVRVNSDVIRQDALIKQIDYLSALLERSQQDILLSRTENTSLREQMTALQDRMKVLMTRMATLESVITQHGLTV